MIFSNEILLIGCVVTSVVGSDEVHSAMFHLSFKFGGPSRPLLKHLAIQFRVATHYFGSTGHQAWKLPSMCFVLCMLVYSDLTFIHKIA